MSRCSAAVWTKTHPVKQAPQWADSPVHSVIVLLEVSFCQCCPFLSGYIVGARWVWWCVLWQSNVGRCLKSLWVCLVVNLKNLASLEWPLQFLNHFIHTMLHTAIDSRPFSRQG